jgi:hypothetical protein
VADVHEHGLREPIVLFEDKILDGRNRYRACTAADIQPNFENYTGDDPVAYAVSLNLRRRHLNESQRHGGGQAAARRVERDATLITLSNVDSPLPRAPVSNCARRPAVSSTTAAGPSRVKSKITIRR